MMIIDWEAEKNEQVDIQHLLGAKSGTTFQCFKHTQGMLQIVSHVKNETP